MSVYEIGGYNKSLMNLDEYKVFKVSSCLGRLKTFISSGQRVKVLTLIYW